MKRFKILIVDDEPLLAETLQRVLCDSHDITVMTNSRKALEMIPEGQFDVVLCDLTMPGISGIDLYETLEKTHPGLEKRIVLMTGGAVSTRANRFVTRLGNRVLEKPFALDHLLALVDRVVAETQPPPA
jgi:DNA-binding NtrC family response regulator